VTFQGVQGKEVLEVVFDLHALTPKCRIQKCLDNKRLIENIAEKSALGREWLFLPGARGRFQSPELPCGLSAVVSGGEAWTSRASVACPTLDSYTEEH